MLSIHFEIDLYNNISSNDLHQKGGSGCGSTTSMNYCPENDDRRTDGQILKGQILRRNERANELGQILKGLISMDKY